MAVTTAGWRTSSRTPNYPPDCVAISEEQGPTVQLRDSKDPEGPRLCLDRRALRALAAAIKAGDLDLPA